MKYLYKHPLLVIGVYLHFYFNWYWKLKTFPLPPKKVSYLRKKIGRKLDNWVCSFVYLQCEPKGKKVMFRRPRNVIFHPTRLCFEQNNPNSPRRLFLTTEYTVFFHYRVNGVTLIYFLSGLILLPSTICTPLPTNTVKNKIRQKTHSIGGLSKKRCNFVQ